MNIWARRLLSLITLLPGLLFVVMGLSWLVDPFTAAESLGMATDSGLGLSSQVGDLAAFFLVAGLSILIALVTGRRTWFYPPAMLLLIAATGRIVSWVVHGATFAPQMIIFEIIVAALLLTASRYLPERD